MQWTSLPQTPSFHKPTCAGKGRLRFKNEVSSTLTSRYFTIETLMRVKIHGGSARTLRKPLFFGGWTYSSGGSDTHWTRYRIHQHRLTGTSWLGEVSRIGVHVLACQKQNVVILASPQGTNPHRVYLTKITKQTFDWVVTHKGIY